MKHVLAMLLLALPAFAAPDGGLDVELLDAGTVLHDSLVCMPPADAQALDLGLRTAEHERDGLKSWLIVAPVAALVVGAVVGGLVMAYVKR